MWLIGRLVPDHKTIADFRKDHGRALREVGTRFVGLCREIGPLSAAGVAIDGSKFKAVNNRDRNFTRAKMAWRRAQIEASVTRYLQQLDTADRQEPSEALATKITATRPRRRESAPAAVAGSDAAKLAKRTQPQRNRDAVNAPA